MIKEAVSYDQKKKATRKTLKKMKYIFRPFRT